MRGLNILKITTLPVALLQAIILQATISPAQANNDSSMIWTYHQYNDVLNDGRPTSEFQVGIPQTDNIVARGSCSVGDGGRFSTVIFGAIIPEHKIDSNISITLDTSDGRAVKQGLAVGADLEEGISGIQLTINNNDLLWRSLSNMNFLSYYVAGQTYTLPLRGSGNTIAKFLRDCNFYASSKSEQFSGNYTAQVRPTFTNKPALKPQIADDPVVINDDEVWDPRWGSCDVLEDKISKKSDFPVTMTIVNKTDSHRAVMWIDFKGNPKEYASLNAGEKYKVNTFVSHPWMFTDGPGNCLEMFMPHQGVDTFNITAPNRDFGPE